MTAAALAELRDWAPALAPHGSVQARQVLEVLAGLDLARAEVEYLREFVLSLSDRIRAQSELLSKRAETKEIVT